MHETIILFMTGGSLVTGITSIEFLFYIKQKSSEMHKANRERDLSSLPLSEVGWSPSLSDIQGNGQRCQAFLASGYAMIKQ
jgi:hypothetical protein